MKSRPLIGKTIKRVIQKRFVNTNNHTVWSLDALQFTDGSYMRFLTIEGDGDYGLDGIYPARAEED